MLLGFHFFLVWSTSVALRTLRSWEAAVWSTSTVRAPGVDGVSGAVACGPAWHSFTYPDPYPPFTRSK